MSYLQILLSVLIIHYVIGSDPSIEIEENKARDFLTYINQRWQESASQVAEARWTYNTNSTLENFTNLTAIIKKVNQEKRNDYQEYNYINWDIVNPLLRYHAKQYYKIGPLVLPKEKYEKYLSVINNMKRVYQNTKICHFSDAPKCDLYYRVQTILKTSRSSAELRHVWVEWQRTVGPHARHFFKEFVELANELARLHNFTNYDAYELNEYENISLRNESDSVWKQILPLYQEIHAYIRGRLLKDYKHEDVISERGPIPASLLENFNEQSKWTFLAKKYLPYSNEDQNNATKTINDNTVLDALKIAEDFFTSINLPSLPDSFWENSILNLTNNCTPLTENFHKSDIFKIKFCPVNSYYENLVLAHRAVARVQYYLQYKHLIFGFQKPANPAFLDAVENFTTLFLKSSSYLHRINVETFNSKTNNTINTINKLFQTAMEKIFPLFFNRAIDVWRSEVITGAIPFENINCKWWELVEKYQGIEAPANRTDEDFDAAASYQNIADTDFTRRILGTIIEFQLHYHLCIKADEYNQEDPIKPLHDCDIYQKTEAGTFLKRMMQMGSSKPWPEALEVVTGQKTIDATGILEYFKPLQKWLEEHNKEYKNFIGWEDSDRICVNSPSNTSSSAK